MKKIINSILAGFFCFFIIYLVGSFTNVSFNISDWTDRSRDAIAILGSFFMLYGFLITFLFLQNEN